MLNTIIDMKNPEDVKMIKYTKMKFFVDVHFHSHGDEEIPAQFEIYDPTS